MSLLDVAGVAQALLDLVGDVAAAEGIDLPERRYLAAGISGLEAWDGEQVVVGLTQLLPGNAARPATLLGQATGVPPGAAAMTAVVLRVEIVRCHPVMDDQGDPPGEAELMPFGIAAMRDAALLHAVRTAATTTAALTGGEPGDILPGAIVPAGPEGGLSGMAMTLTVTALGIEPVT